jgi:O-methyltransferase involved in polyketide biosynthesis
MTTNLHDRTPVQETMFLTPYGRALDSRAPHPILGDKMTDEIVGKIDYDFTRLKLGSSIVVQIALRAKMLDKVVRRFVADHPDAVVLDLGAGLDDRMFRVAPPPTVDWYDVDLPEVIALRRSVLPEHAQAHAIGASLTDSHWLDQISADRPTMIVADGLLAFLTEEDIISLLTRLTSHFHSGDLAFNDYGRLTFSAWAMNLSSMKSVAALIRFAGFNDPHQPERWNPRLTLVEESKLAQAPEVALFPPCQ